MCDVNKKEDATSGPVASTSGSVKVIPAKFLVETSSASDTIETVDLTVIQQNHQSHLATSSAVNCTSPYIAHQPFDSLNHVTTTLDTLLNNTEPHQFLSPSESQSPSVVYPITTGTAEAPPPSSNNIIVNCLTPFNPNFDFAYLNSSSNIPNATSVAHQQFPSHPHVPVTNVAPLIHPSNGILLQSNNGQHVSVANTQHSSVVDFRRPNVNKSVSGSDKFSGMEHQDLFSENLTSSGAVVRIGGNDNDERRQFDLKMLISLNKVRQMTCYSCQICGFFSTNMEKDKCMDIVQHMSLEHDVDIEDGEYFDWMDKHQSFVEYSRDNKYDVKSFWWMRQALKYNIKLSCFDCPNQFKAVPGSRSFKVHAMDDHGLDERSAHQAYERALTECRSYTLSYHTQLRADYKSKLKGLMVRGVVKNEIYLHQHKNDQQKDCPSKLAHTTESTEQSAVNSRLCLRIRNVERFVSVLLGGAFSDDGEVRGEGDEKLLDSDDLMAESTIDTSGATAIEGYPTDVAEQTLIDDKTLKSITQFLIDDTDETVNEVIESSLSKSSSFITCKSNAQLFKSTSDQQQNSVRSSEAVPCSTGVHVSSSQHPTDGVKNEISLQQQQVQGERGVGSERRKISDKDVPSQHVCSVCGESFESDRKLRLHRADVHRKPKVSLTCDQCGYNATRQFDMRVHLRKHTGEKPYVCNFRLLSRHRASACRFRTADHNSLRRHIASQHYHGHQPPPSSSKFNMDIDPP